MVKLQDFVYGDDGDPVSGATVEVWEYGGLSAVDSTTTDSDGKFTFSNLEDGQYQIRVTWGGETRTYDSDVFLQVSQIVGPDGSSAPLGAASVTGSMIAGGHGSSVNADLLDGKHASEFALQTDLPEAVSTFKTVNAGGTELVADLVEDTLTVSAGNGISVSGNASTDTLTIAASLTTSTTALNGTVNLSTSSFTTILSRSLAAGTWLVLAQAAFSGFSNGTFGSSGGGQVYVRLVNGSTSLIEGYAHTESSHNAYASLAGIVTLNSTSTIDLQAKSSTSSIKATNVNDGTGVNLTQLTVIRIA